MKAKKRFMKPAMKMKFQENNKVKLANGIQQAFNEVIQGLDQKINEAYTEKRFADVISFKIEREQFYKEKESKNWVA